MQNTQRPSCSSAVTQKQVVMYNSSNNIPSFFNFQKNINGQYFQIIGKKIDNTKYIVRIIDGSNNKMKEMTITKNKIKDIISGKINFSTAVTTIMNTKSTSKKKSVSKKKPVVKKKSIPKKVVSKKKATPKKKSVSKKKPSPKKKVTSKKK